ncbi:carbon monoxide dehydrogenase subunit G [Nonomuraea turkmeniaca]|uniref:Carbon monoxide dehydrogenase subunit G n=1 Tax=Nonomuraea turkmeniaca TaxID=103838 RepID=A0A5S4FEN8_9ACTN|nr:carbon monoxide dehydrogenase subunit G [Nonomuraea turkmeniaca]TMR16499.1 carbon monoxide dehydrogenase subunit G [Nonomuraea turkmeniaca]
MKVAGSAVIGVQRDQVWAALQDPAVLVRTIPGCERLEAVAVNTYKMTVNAGVASIKGVYQGEVALADPLAPESFTLKARGQGAPGTVDATVQLRLSEIDGGTRVDYDADAVIGGMIGGVGQRMLGSVAKRTAGEFFAAVEDHLRAPAAPAPGPAPDLAPGLVSAADGAAVPASAVPGAPAAGERTGAAGEAGAVGAVYERPPKRHTETRPWVMLASFGMGAGIALTSVAIGWVLGRASRRS